MTGSPNNGSYQVEVQSLATSHTLASQTEFASTSSVVGEGTLTFNVGGAVTNIAIDATNNTLSGIQQAVNDAGIGVNATVVNVGTGYKLMFSSAQSGAGNTIDVSITGDTDGNDTDAAGLSRLATANMDETVAAQDATVVVNGLTITNSGNTIDGVIEGISLNLKSSDIGSTKQSKFKMTLRTCHKPFKILSICTMRWMKSSIIWGLRKRMKKMKPWGL